MKIVAVIPARYGSKRFAGKPLAELAGKPMVVHVYERAASSPILDAVLVATDDTRIAEAVIRANGRVVMTAKGHRSGTDRVAEAVAGMNLRQTDIVINIQADQPLFDPKCIEQVVSPLFLDDSLPMATLVHGITDDREIDNPNNVKAVLGEDGSAIYFSRSRIPFFRSNDVPKIYYKHLGIYAFRRHFLTTFAQLPEGKLEAAEKLEQLRVLENGFRIKAVETEFHSLGVDTPEQLAWVAQTLRGGLWPTPLRPSLGVMREAKRRLYGQEAIDY
ncbi:MAG: 3-deoxy-manno-octulosonate cytidylyltransferase [Deltaproteobacteria bacterium]|nr:3-deoxy-manno-octulosonate cytidylyltransferase [Deltaproteobacteria bacterium]